MAGHSHDVFHHVRDELYIEVPQFMGSKIPIEQVFGDSFSLTKLMVMEVIVAVALVFVLTTYARRVRDGVPPRGRLWNFIEAIIFFLRDQVIRPTIGTGHHHGDEHHDDAHHGDTHHGEAHAVGHAPASGHGHAVALTTVAAHPADKYLPFVATIFFFVLFSNLIGAIPFVGSPTQSIWATIGLAVWTCLGVVFYGSKELGFVGFVKGLCPTLDVPPVLKVLLVPMMYAIEAIGFVIKHGVLAVRLFANIAAGHTVIALILGFIEMANGSPWLYLIAPASTLGQVGISLMELFVAFLQAYIFAFLTTLFIATAVHPH